MYRNFVFLVSAIFLGRCAWFMTMPFMAIYFAKSLHATPIEIGVVLGVGLLSSCVFGLFIGGLTDRFNSRLLLFIGNGFSAAIFILFAAHLSLFSYGVLNFCLGVFRSLLDTAGQGYILDLLPEAKRSMGLNFRYMLINMSNIIGPLLGGFLSGQSMQHLFVVAAVIYMVSVLVLLILPQQQKARTGKNIFDHLQASMKLLSKDHAAKMVFFIEGVSCIGFAQIETTLPQIMAAHIQHYVYFYSWVLALNGILVISCQMLIGWVLEKVPSRNIAFIFSGLLTLSFICFGMAKATIIFFLAMTVFTFAEIIGVSFYNKLINQYSTEQNRGAYFGVLSFGLIGFPLGAFFGGWLLKAFGGGTLFLCAAVISVLVGVYVQLNSQENFES